MTLIFLDFETTGLNVYHDDITEYSMIERESGYSVCSLVQLKNKRCITPFITKKTGITTEMVQGGQTQEEAVTCMVDFINAHSTSSDTVTIIAHNGDAFDFLIFRRLLKEYNIHPKCRLEYFDTLRFAQKLIPRLYSFSQENLCKQFHITNKAAHRAYGDTESLVKVYTHLTRLYSSRKSDIKDHRGFTYENIN